jgi:hypothetical protein
MQWERYRKLIVFVVGVVPALILIWWPGNMRLTDTLGTIILALTGLGVYQVKNAPMPKVVGDDPNTGWADGGVKDDRTWP